MFAGSMRAKIYNCYVEANLETPFGSIYAYDCVLSNTSKPRICSWNKCHIHGLKDATGSGINWYWTTAVTASYPLTFDNVWLATDVPGFAGITTGNNAPSVNNIAMNSSIFWVNSPDKFISKVKNTNGVLTLEDLV